MCPLTPWPHLLRGVPPVVCLCSGCGRGSRHTQPTADVVAPGISVLHEDGTVPVIVSGAGHDAMALAELTKVMAQTQCTLDD